ncbi:MAG: porin family protein [Rhizobiales bacterium]|nr:porin family protein [Hyphomicrobiales bacterium]
MRRLVIGLLGAAAMSVAANAADMPVKAPIVKAPVAVPFSWAGFYAGLNAGYVWGRSTQTDITGYNLADSTIGYNPRGFQGGGHFGYNWQFNQFVLGIEGEIGGFSWNKSAQYGPYIGVRGANDSVASTSNGVFGVIAGRAGVAFDNVLLFAKGGGIFTSVKNSFIDTDPTGITLTSGTDTKNRNGWTVGGGLEYAFNRNWAVRIEYAHYGFGTVNHTAIGSNGVAYTFSHSLSADSVRGGVTYLFH